MQCFNYIALFIPFIFLSQISFSQDERFFRGLFSGTLKEQLHFEGVTKTYKWQVHSQFYEIDLTGDGTKEALVINKLDGTDWIHIHDKWKAHVRSFKLQAKGSDAKIYKINIRNLSLTTRVLVIQYYEGKTEFLELKGSARLFFMTIDNQKLASVALFKGPAIWSEQDDSFFSYSQRKYKFELFDYNNDGQKEIVVKYHKIPRIYKYQQNGRWVSL